MAEKKLVRSANKKLAGVCGGLAEFFGLDASIVRIVWLLCILLGGGIRICAKNRYLWCHGCDHDTGLWDLDRSKYF